MEQHPGNFSNIYKKGTKYYSIKGINTDEAIAVQDEERKYKKAIRGEKYTFGSTDEYTGSDEEKNNFPDLTASLLVLFTIIIMISLFVIKKIKR